MLDADREVVGRHAVLRALLVARARALVVRGDVPRPARLAHELGDLGAVLLDDVVRARAGRRVPQPAPAAGVAALAGVDHDEADLGAVAAREVRRRPPHRRRVVRGPGAGAALGRGRDLGVRRQRRDHGAVLGDLGRAPREHVEHVVDVRGPRVVIRVLRERGDHRGPREQVVARDPVLARERRQPRRGGRDVRAEVRPGGVLGDPGRGRAEREVVARQREQPRARGPALVLLLADHHLPAGLDVGDRLEQIGRDLVGARRDREVIVEPGRGRRIDLDLDPIRAARDRERGDRDDAHGPKVPQHGPDHEHPGCQLRPRTVWADECRCSSVAYAAIGFSARGRARACARPCAVTRRE